MRKFKISIFLISIFIASFSSDISAQQRSLSSAEFALKLAKRMRDTLALTVPEYQQVLAANLEVQEEIKAAHRDNAKNPTAVKKQLEQVERKRDQRYRKLLPAAKYQLYLNKKANIFNIQ